MKLRRALRVSSLPRLTDLMAKLPDIDIRVNARGSHLQGDRTPFPQLADAPADLQIVYGDRDIWEDRASLLLSEVVQPYATPAFLAQHGIDQPGKLARKMLISTARNVVSWDEWLNQQGVDIDESPVGSIQMDPSHLAIRAAGTGVGVILESSVLVAEDVSLGTLVPLFPHLSRPGVGYWTYMPSAHNLRPSVEAVRDWLTAMAAAESLP